MADNILRRGLLKLILIVALFPIFNSEAQKQLVIKPVSEVVSFVPEENMASVIILSPIKDLNISSTLGEKGSVEINSDSLYLYRFMFDISEEAKRVISISAPGYVKEYIRLMLHSKQKLLFTAFPPEGDDRFSIYKMVGYSFSGYAPFGLMVAYGKRFGGFLRFNSSFRGKRGFDIENYRTDGPLYNPAGANKLYNIRTSITAGVQIAIIPPLFFQVGVGYGEYANQWKKGKDYFYSDSYNGFQLDFGALYNFKNYYLNGGVIVMTASKVIVDFHVGIGYVFK